jgi:hypothetical protein
MNPTFIEVLEDPKLLGQFIGDQKSRRVWKSFWKAVDALEPDDFDLKLFKHATGRSKWPTEPVKEAWVICGVRAGKTENIALRKAYEATFHDHKLSPGERGYYLIVSPTKKQSGILKTYLSSYFNDNDFFRPFLLKETAEEITLTNNVVISCLASDYRSLRGFTGLCATVEEAGYLPFEGSRPAEEVVRALRSRLISTKGRLYSIGSPYGKAGSLFETFKRHYGKDNSSILVWKASSRLMNPTLSKSLIQQAYAEDPEAARADYGGEFRSDIETFVRRKVVEAAVVPGRYELPPMEGVQYVGFCDPSGGTADSMTLAVGHKEGETLVLDCLRESKPPFNPDSVVQEFAETLKRYGLASVTGDRYGGIWPSERFLTHGITYNVSTLAKSDCYREFLPLLNSGQVELLDSDSLVNQLCNLERRVGRGGKDSIDHARGAKDDLANVCAGVLTLLAGKREAVPVFIGWLDGDMNFEPAAFTEQAGQQDQPETTGQQTGSRQPRRIR